MSLLEFCHFLSHSLWLLPPPPYPVIRQYWPFFLVTVTSITLILIISHLTSAVRNLLSGFPAFHLQPMCLFNQSIVHTAVSYLPESQPFVYINTHLKILSNAHSFLQNKTYTQHSPPTALYLICKLIFHQPKCYPNNDLLIVTTLFLIILFFLKTKGNVL